MSTDLITLIDGQAVRFEEVSCKAPGIEFEREKQFALQILRGNDYLSRFAAQNPDSLRNAVTNLSAIGISLNPASKLAYLVPRKGGVCLDISYMGMMHIAQQCGAIQWGQSIVVRENDVFKAQGVGIAPIHEYQPFDRKRGNPIGVYCIVKTDGGDFLYEAMTMEEIEEIRDRSESYKTYKKDNSKLCPWVTDFLEMAKKTVVKRASKYWPRRDRLDQAVHYLNTDGGEGFAPIQNGAGQQQQQEAKDVTPSTPDQQIAIDDQLRVMKKTFADLGNYFTTKFGETFESSKDLTKEQATAVLAFLEKRK